MFLPGLRLLFINRWQLTMSAVNTRRWSCRRLRVSWSGAKLMLKYGHQSGEPELLQLSRTHRVTPESGLMKSGTKHRDAKAGTNRLFPIFVKLEELKVVIIGGGKVATEKLTAI